GHFRAEVEKELRELFARYFDPDNFTFGEPVILSRIVAAAASVEGVDAVVIDRFRRQGQPKTDAIASGVLAVGPLEIARLENSRDFPEHGSLTIAMRGGV
ncbi:MAG TPA: putative baseplate assembly protein, partial [Thermoanaerobaculia bacterium]|nr:putative baseplate assembly protein [Thermoanaerobaculia bacterium]